MTKQEAIEDILNNIKPIVGGKSLDIAVECIEKCINEENMIKDMERLENENKYIMDRLQHNKLYLD